LLKKALTWNAAKLDGTRFALSPRERYTADVAQKYS
jgi:hypothetical protein